MNIVGVRIAKMMRLGVTLLLLTASVLPGGAATAARNKSGVKALSADVIGDRVEISGWATFSGQHMGSTKDPKDDGLPTADVAHAEGGEIIGSDFIYRPENEDLFWRIEVTKIPSTPNPGGIPTAGSVNTLYGLMLTIKGTSFEIRAHKVGSLDLNNPTGNAFGLFRCAGETGCVFVAPLRGGYGTTGERVVVALPLSVIRDQGGVAVEEGDPIGELHAYTAVGQFATGAADLGLMDEARLIDTARVDIPVKSVKVTVRKTTVKADLKDGHFKAIFAGKLFREERTLVRTKTCLGVVCVKQSFKVTPEGRTVLPV